MSPEFWVVLLLNILIWRMPIDDRGERKCEKYQVREKPKKQGLTAKRY